MTNQRSPSEESYLAATEIAEPGASPLLRPGVIAMILAVMLALLLAASAWGYVNLQAANRSNDALNAAQAELAAARAELGVASTSIQAAEGRSSELKGRVTDLSECVTKWRTASEQGRALVDLEDRRFRLLSTGSAWAKAYTARENALLGALEDRYDGFLFAYNGNKTKANAAIVASNKKLTTATAQGKVMTSEIAKITALGSQVASKETAFKGKVAELAASCPG